MNVKKCVMIIAVLLLSTLLFAGCGNRDQSNGNVEGEDNYKANDYTDGWEKYTNSYNSKNGSYITRSDNYIFYIWKLNDGKAILRMKSDDSDKQIIVRGMDCSSVALYDDGIIFLSDVDRRIYRANADGTEIVCLSDVQTDWFEVHNGNVYYIDGYYEWDPTTMTSISCGSQNLYCMDINSGKTARVTTFQTNSVNIVEDVIYCYNLDDKTVVKIDERTTTPTIIYDDQNEEISNFVVYKDYIYYTYHSYQEDMDGIYRISVDSKEKTNVIKTVSYNFTFYQDTLFYDADANSSAYEMRYCKLNGSDSCTISTQTFWTPVVLGEDLYFLDEISIDVGISGRINKIDPKTYDSSPVKMDTQLVIGVEEVELISTSIEPYYIYQDKISLLWGIYNKDTDQIVMEPTMEEIGVFDSTGVAPAKRDGYWGYINCYGGTIIDFFFDKADTFVGDYATVYCRGSGTGVIDRNGSYIIDPQYTDIVFKDSFILAVKSYSLSLPDCYAYDYSGKRIISKAYDGFGYGSIKEYNGLLYAQPKGSNRYELYDCAGNRITGVGEWENVRYVSYPENGVHILYYGQEGAWGSYQDAGMRIADEQFNILNVEYYNSLSAFNNLGFAVAENQARGWHIIKADGSALQNLPIHEIYGVEVGYTYANEYIACCMARVGMTGKYYGTVNLKTGKMNTWSNVEPVDGTNCIIVTDENTGLKGLYDRESLVLNCVYKEIKYKDGVFERTRGAITDTYTPS